MTRRNRRTGPDLELRVMVDGQVAIGPVQAMLLEAIRSTGSIAAAQRQIGASYAHVWKLMAAMNKAFTPPLVDR
jgi:molybdate transport system regulatory protein